MSKHEIELQELLTFFKTAKYPEVPFELNKYLKVSDVDSLIRKCVSDISNYKGSEIVLDSLFKHLRELKEIAVKKAGKEAEKN